MSSFAFDNNDDMRLLMADEINAVSGGYGEDADSLLYDAGMGAAIGAAVGVGIVAASYVYLAVGGAVIAGIAWEAATGGIVATTLSGAVLGWVGNGLSIW